ncbi:MAG: thiolase domain-containing protein [Euryarchaeota archaeon]|nr:thiolase domain-containing protein [Euryarchaeota archaeon]MDE1836385.1 thiolase domain-containing protein [Euryarchaeota archaeon]MDE1881481.1 thiolase domain-containing protein [Euryarchaeota archaeon]MDE2046484.1 thiolase domain-containing protein [Thermoplasmata archaeon]
MEEVWVAGAAMNKFGKMSETGREAAAKVSLEAIQGAGLQPKDIEYTFVSNCFGVAERQAHVGPLINTALGIPQVPSATIESACSSSSAALHEAYVHVAGGFLNAALVVGVEKLSHMETLAATSYFAMGSDYAFEARNGATFPGLYATLASAHMHKYGTKSEQLGAVAVKNHQNASGNPHAHFQKPISMDTYMNSAPIAWPLKLYDCCPFSDGAAAVVVLNPARFRHDVPITPAVIRASTRAGSIAALQDRPDLTALPASHIAGEKAFKQAKVSPKDIDFSEVHDCFTIAEVLAMEDLGFYPKGKAAQAAAEGQTAVDGATPINVSGGLKAKGHPVSATGAAQVVEVFEQFNGHAGKRQVKDPQWALAHNVGATGGSCSVHIFERK